VLARLLREEPQVLSTGGGAFMNHTNRVEISNHGVAVWMRVEVNLLWARVKLRSNRPLLQTDNPYQTLVELYKARAPIYAKAPIHVTAYSNYAVDDMVRSVIEHLAEHKDVLEISPYDGPERRRRRRR
ncbi:MAG: shikimate kinase, partial [Mangrovicoccus sp.]